MASSFRCVLVLDGLPIDLLLAQDAKQQWGALRLPLREHFAVEVPEDQEVVSGLDARHRRIACNGTDAAPDLQVEDGSAQRLALATVGRDGVRWR